jgi:hypothetical protein
MKHFIKIGEVDVLPILLQLDKHPELWDIHPGRRMNANSPHNGLSDLWLRYRALDELEQGVNHNEPFFPPVWYPEYYILSEVKPIIQSVMTRVNGTALGGCLFTKIPPGKQVKPHTDEASWHARTYNLKAYVTIKSNPNVVNYTEDEPLVMRPGEVWTFDNLKMHSVINNGDDDRITLMMAIRTE